LIAKEKMKNRSGFTFGLILLIVLLFASLLSCNQDEIIVGNDNIVGKWKYVDVSDSIDHYEHLLIFESDSTFKYKISSYKSVPIPDTMPGPIYGLFTTEDYIGKYSINGNNLKMNADSLYFQLNIFDLSVALEIDVSFYDGCKFTVVDTVLTLNYSEFFTSMYPKIINS
jgi:hypothetical protein